MQRRHPLTVHQVHARARLRRAFEDSRFQPATPSYGELAPRRRGLVTPRNEMRLARQSERNHERGTDLKARLAGEEFSFVAARLEEELKAIAWVLILEEKLTGEDVALSAVEFGKRLGGMRSEDHARWYALGALKVVAARLTSIYRHWELARKATTAHERFDGARKISD